MKTYKATLEVRKSFTDNAELKEYVEKYSLAEIVEKETHYNRQDAEDAVLNADIDLTTSHSDIGATFYLVLRKQVTTI